MKKLKFIYLNILLCVGSFSYGQCPNNDIGLNSQSDVDNFILNYPSCKIIEKTLYIGNRDMIDPIIDLSKLDNIEEIKGNLIIKNTQLNNLNALKRLVKVGGDFIIINNRKLVTIEGFNKLEKVGGDFKITQNHVNLKRIEGFNNLRVIEGNFQISDHDSPLEYISEFENLTEVKGWFFIGRNNGNLPKISGFNKLVMVGNASNIIGLTIELNRGLEKINGFNSLIEVIGSVNIQQNTNLTAVLGFNFLEKISYQMVFNRCPSLIEVPLFEKLVTIGSGLELWDTGLVEIKGFNHVQIIGNLDPSWGNLYINENENLLEISGFTKLTDLKGALSIGQNNKLINLKGFSNVSEVRSLLIGGNASLENLSGLEKIFIVDATGGTAISISGNTSLTDCSVLCNLLTNGIVNGTISILDNPSKCSSESEVREECVPDFDDDGILDDDDLDDDNDGILDTVEQNGDVDRDSDSDGYPDHKDLDSDNDGCLDVIEAGFEDDDGNGTLGNLPDEINSQGIITNEITGYTTPLDTNLNNIKDFQENTLLSSGSDGVLSICKSSSSVDLFASLGGSPDSGGVWTPSLSSGTGVFNPSIDTSGSYIYTVTNGVCGSVSSKVDVTVVEVPVSGSDGNLSICKSSNPVDLLISLGGSPDSGGVWIPSLSSGAGIFNPSVDTSGSYIYTVTNGVCGSVSSKIDVTVVEVPVSGSDGNLSICKSSSPVDLYTSLGGLADSGGVWGPSLSSNTGIFDPSIDTSGIYTYTVTNGVCGSVSSKVEVTVEEVPASGLDGDLSICKSSGSVNLFTSLGGLPDSGGIWTPSLSSGTGIFDPSIDNSGSYTYTVTNGVCGSVSSKVNVTVVEIPVSGSDGDLSICKNSSSVDLFSSLGGSPDSGGLWIPNLSSGTGIFDPSIDTSGIYTYTVTNGVCGSVSSKVEVSVFDEYQIVDYKIDVIEFNDKNSITVTINQTGNYEYSLNGGSYTLNSMFSNLAGGDYDVSVREINGCGRLNKRIVLIDYPRFFTPNDDGFNDVWGLKGTISRKYLILIYDRFGKVLKELKNSNDSWEGNYLGKKMPSNDYWFQIIFEDGLVKTGNFSLLRK
ncbi:T9SS type B sorting domain-containing protein [Tenacibaculum bernardetii]|uniref:T9SS type B sorting domain-containing protein n=1 Tax=Tenacibaculum bernardetii TaxID=3021375 RepID=UPI0023B1DA10|nr:T9SS type B sorting domain-containing protein [Tenacibaculum bernardetii]